MLHQGKPAHRICILTSEHQALDHRVFYKQAVSLANLGHEVHVFGPHPKNEVRQNVHIHAVPKLKNRLVRKICSSFRFFIRAVKENADVYHFHDPDLIPCGLALRILGQKVIMDVHEDYKLALLKKRRYFPEKINPFVATLIDAVIRGSAALFSSVVVVSEELKNNFKGRNVSVVRNFPLLWDYKKNPAPNRNLKIVYTGNIDESRGCWEILAAFNLFIRKYPQAELWMIGQFRDAALEHEFRDSASRIKSVNIPGLMPWEQVKQIQCKADIGLLLSSLNKESHEKFYPVKLFEYLAAGLPVIISRKPFWHRLMEQGGFGSMVEHIDPKDIADALGELAADSHKRETLGLAGRKFVEKHFSWDKEFIKLRQLYDRVLNS